MANIVRTTDALVHVLDPGYRWLDINRTGADEFERVFSRKPQVRDRLLNFLAGQPK
jgi:hypothetical protein